ncbi:MAG: DUF2520 domain-containing protein [Tatlockia sp.]|nr:DUF2520 domain-containing protein [Tatlockia sp.]
MKFNIIGAGRLGKVIGQALLHSKQGELLAVCNSHFSSAKLAVEQLGSGTAVANPVDLPSADITFITTPDDNIPEMAKRLAEEKILRPRSLVIHCSGVLSSEVLNPLKNIGCYIASLHPLRAFKKIDLHLNQSAFEDCDCVVEGEDEALATISPLFKKLGAKIIPIKAEGKTVYHTAAVIASNYLVTLAATAVELFTEAGIEPSLAKQMTTNLMTSSLNNIQQSAHVAEALTGPLQRADISTLNKHLQALAKPTTKALYVKAALATLPLTRLSEEHQEQIQALLEDSCNAVTD